MMDDRRWMEWRRVQVLLSISEGTEKEALERYHLVVLLQRTTADRCFFLNILKRVLLLLATSS